MRLLSGGAAIAQGGGHAHRLHGRDDRNPGLGANRRDVADESGSGGAARIRV